MIMNYEQKYKEALERARAINNGKDVDVEAGTTTCEYIFPELKESEDEKIRKWLLDFVQGLPDEGLDFNFYNLSKKQVVAWLEKQCENKSILSEDDEDMIQALNTCIDIVIKSGMNYISFDSKAF